MSNYEYLADTGEATGVDLSDINWRSCLNTMGLNYVFASGNADAVGFE